MRKINLLFLTLLMTATIAAQTSTKEQRAVQQTIENMFTALTNSDTSALKMYLTRDVNFLEYGQIWNSDTIAHKAMLGKTIPDFKRINSFEYVNTTINQKTAWVTYYLQSTITKGGKEAVVKWLETVILIRSRNHWKINVLHSTRLVNR